jgi:hypothetical protein
MDVGIAVFHDARHGLNNGPRLLGRGGAVEINQGFTVDLAAQNWNIAIQRGNQVLTLSL